MINIQDAILYTGRISLLVIMSCISKIIIIMIYEKGGRKRSIVLLLILMFMIFIALIGYVVVTLCTLPKTDTFHHPLFFRWAACN